MKKTPVSLFSKEEPVSKTDTEIFDEYCWEKHKQILTKDKHQIVGLANFAHYSINSSVAPTPLHYHSNIFEIHCLVKGKRITTVKSEMETRSEIITGNEAFITFPYELHSTGNVPQNPCEFYAVQIDVTDKDNLLGLNKEYSNELYHRLLALKHRHLRMASNGFSLIRTAFNLFSSPENADRQCGVQFLTCFLFQLSYLPSVDTIEKKLDTNMTKVLEYIENHLHDPIALYDLAEVSGYSLSRFKIKFKEEVGITPAEYISLQKMELAKKLLETTDKSVTDIAFELGFSSSNYFCTVFKKLINCSPYQYKKRQGN